MSQRRTFARRLVLGRLLAVGAAVVGGAALAASALAVPPTTTSGTFTGPNSLTGTCPFTVDVVSTVTFRETDFFDKSGAQTMAVIHVVEEDVFTANGKTLIGLPFTFQVQVLFDSAGNVTHVYANGLTERVPLPDGSTFVSAGRLDFVAHPGATFLISPDKGNSGNVAAFCAALAP